MIGWLLCLALAQVPEPVAPAPAEPVPTAVPAPVEPAPVAAPAAPVVEVIERRVAPEPEPPPAPEPAVPIFEYGPPVPVEPEVVLVDFVGPVQGPSAPSGDPPAAASPAPTVVVNQPPAERLLTREVVPWVAVRGFLPGAVLLFVTLMLVLLADVMSRLRQKLARRGVLPDIARLAGTGARILAAACALGVLAAWVPANLAPALPWIFVGVAVAVGWSARDLLPDTVAFAVMLVEGRVRPGRWVSGEGFRGEVQAVGPRATVLLDEAGSEVTVPNRILVLSPYARDPSTWPKIEVHLSLPSGLDPQEARAALREAVLLCPWIAPGEVELRADTEGSGRWSVSARLLEGTFLAAFEGSLRERLADVLEARKTP